MIGTGIFITTGNVLELTMDPFVVLVLWAIGGIIALTGTLCYAELATMWPHVGGEYIYLKNSFGFLPSFLTGWISLVVGFSASVAISAISFVQYLDEFWRDVSSQVGDPSIFFGNGLFHKGLACAVILLFGAIHIHGVKSGSRIQNVLTVIKLLVVISLIGFGLYYIDWSLTDRLFSSYSEGTNNNLNIPVISLSLLIIMFSYSGWNGATYIAGEIKDVEKRLPKALFMGTVLTTILYIGLNIVFLMSTPGRELMGDNIVVGSITARNLFGVRASSLFTLGITLILLSSISVQMMIGPRVYYAMARDKMIFRALGRVNPRFETPTIAIVIQIILTIFYILVGNAALLMKYLGFALGIFPVLTVIGLMYMRKKHPEFKRPFKVPFYPITPLVFIILSTAMLLSSFFAEMKTSTIAIAVVLAGIPIFFLWRKFAHKNNNNK